MYRDGEHKRGLSPGPGSSGPQFINREQLFFVWLHWLSDHYNKSLGQEAKEFSQKPFISKGSTQELPLPQAPSYHDFSKPNKRGQLPQAARSYARSGR